MTSLTPEQYQEMFAARRNATWALLQLTRNQLTWIQQEQFDKLLSVVQQKEPAVRRFDEATQTIRRSWANWQVDREQMSELDRTPTETLLDETQALLHELIELDQQGIEELKVKRDQTQALLQELAQGAAVHDAVQSTTAPSTNRQLDING